MISWMSGSASPAASYRKCFADEYREWLEDNKAETSRLTLGQDCNEGQLPSRFELESTINKEVQV